MTKLLTPMPLSPHAKTVGVTLIGATEIVVDNIEYFPTPGENEEGYALLCAAVDFKSNNPADYEGVIYTGRDVGNSKLTGVTRNKEGTAREWPAGTTIACYSSAEYFKRVNAAVKSLLNFTAAGGLKNKLINGDFGIWQRGTSFTANNVFTADRWYFTKDTNDTHTITRQGVTVGQLLGDVNPKYFMRVSVTAGATGASNRLWQMIENVRTLSGQKATVSFYAKASKSITVSTQLRQYFGTGGTPSDTVFTAAEASFITTGWQRYEATFDVPSVSGKTLGTNGNDGMGVVFNLPYNDTYDFDICLAQLEAGEIATPFEQRPADLELALCGAVDDSDTLTGSKFLLNGITPDYIAKTSRSDNLVSADKTEPFWLPNYVLREGRRVVWVNFTTYDTIVTAITGTGSVTQIMGAPDVRSAASADTAIQRISSGLLNMIGAAGSAAVLEMGFSWLSVDTIDCEAFIGLTASDNTVVLSTSTNYKHIGFLFQINGATKTVYAVNCNGAGGRTATDLSLSTTAARKYSVEWDGTSLKFYVDGTLAATHTTNVPSSPLPSAWKMSIQGNAAGSVAFNAREFVYRDCYL